MYDGSGQTYTGEYIQVYTTYKYILTEKNLERWPYLGKVKLKEIDTDIDLLIEVDVPKALEPWDIIHSQANGPYVIKTLFGWVGNGHFILVPLTFSQIRPNHA